MTSKDREKLKRKIARKLSEADVSDVARDTNLSYGTVAYFGNRKPHYSTINKLAEYFELV